MNSEEFKGGILVCDDDGQPNFLAIKRSVGLRKFWYRLLKLGGINDWESEYDVAVDEESSGPELYRFIGKLPFESDFIGLNCLYFSSQMFILCEEIVIEVENNHIFLQNASIYRYEDAQFEQIGDSEDLYLTSPETKLEEYDRILVEDLNELSSSIISYNEDGDVQYTSNFDDILNTRGLEESTIGPGYWEVNFEDLEALIEISPFWGINNNFTST
jgi:hypothetical protein